MIASTKSVITAPPSNIPSSSDDKSQTSSSNESSNRSSQEPISMEIVGHYQLEKTLGEGTYGKVKLATDLRTGAKVAVKLLDKANIKHRRQISRIQREIRFLKLIHHPNIVQVYEVLETPTSIFIVCEYVPGGELFDYIVAHKRLKEHQARQLFRQIVSAVDYCHQNAIIHRDLKPENLLLDANKCIKIIDFGFANTFMPNNFLETFCGSPFYAAPEIILAKKYEGPEVDIWSLGVILYALVCGFLPFDNPNVKTLYLNISTATYDMPDFVSTPCRNLIGRMLTVDTKKRANIHEVKRDAWVIDGHQQPPMNHIPARIPIGPDELDDDIVKKLGGFGYKSEEIVESFRHYQECANATPSSVLVDPIVSTYYLVMEKANRKNSAPQRLPISSNSIKEERRKRETEILESAMKNFDLKKLYQEVDDFGKRPVSVPASTPVTSSGAFRTRSGSASNLEQSRTVPVAGISHWIKGKTATISSGKFGLVRKSASIDHIKKDDSATSSKESHKTRSESPIEAAVEAGPSAVIINREKRSASIGSSQHVVPLRSATHVQNAIRDHRPFTIMSTSATAPPGQASPVSPSLRSGDKEALARRLSLNFRNMRQRSQTEGPHIKQVPTVSLRSGGAYTNRTRLTPAIAPPSPVRAIPNGMRLVSSYLFNSASTSSKSPDLIIEELDRVLEMFKQAGISFEMDASVYAFNVRVFVPDFKHFFHESAGKASATSHASDPTSSVGSTDSGGKNPDWLKFQIEICAIANLKLFGLHFKRTSGNLMSFKTVCGKLLATAQL